MKRLLLALALAFCGTAAHSAALTDTDARRAAENFLAYDDVGSRILAGRSVASVAARGALYVARLSPSGYVVLSGDSAAEPVVAFSPNDYSEPEDGSPLGSLLAAASTNAATASASAAVAEAMRSVSAVRAASLSSAATASAPSDAAARRAAKWQRLLPKPSALPSLSSRSSLPSVSLASWTDPSSLSVTVDPFLTTKWNQIQPFNDFVPVNRAASADNSYRQRYPCGCVATAYAQILNYWQWPKRMNATFSCDHEIYDYDNGTKENTLRDTPFKVRFDAHEPFDWTQMRDTYPTGSRYTGWDLRGKTAESVRFPVARLVMMSAVMAKMYYAGGGSGANIQPAADANPWYRQTNAIVRTSLGDEAFFGLVRDDLARGIPVGVTVPGHQVVAHGWASGTDGTRYVYLNYGWSGQNDGYFNVSETDTEETAKGYVDSALVGHVPLQTAQLDPLPAVSEPGVTLSWHVPERIAGDFAGYTVHVRRRVDTPSVWTEGFSSYGTATDSASGIFVGESWGIGAGSPFLRVRPLASGAFDLMGERTLTSRSLLTYRVRSDRAYGLTVRVQGRFDGGEWQDLDVPPLGDGYEDTGWATRRVFLGDRGGNTLRLRVVAENNSWRIEASDTRIGVQFDDFALSDVLGYDETAVAGAADSRSVTLENLEAGASYVFSVTPQGDGATESEAVQTTIAGTVRSPLPGAETFLATNFAYTVGSADWTLSTGYLNTPSQDGGTSVTLGAYDGSLALAEDWTATADGVLSFGWTAKGSYTATSDVVTVTFTATDGAVTTFYSVTNWANKTAVQRVALPLAPVAGKRGRLKLVFSHSGSNYNYKGYGATIYDLAVSGLAASVLPDAVAWGEEERTATERPRILSVSSRKPSSPAAVQEGLYRECARGANALLVVCSGNVTSLSARPSHLSLVPDPAVRVYPKGGGRFVVTVDGSAIAAADDRSRMILTLVAESADGQLAYKDLSLRFSAATGTESYPGGLVIVFR